LADLPGATLVIHDIHSKQLIKTVKGISLHFVKMHLNFHLSYGILLSKYKNVTITLQKEQENPLKISFCCLTGDQIVIYVSTRGHVDN
jgi:hypothetical protein